MKFAATILIGSDDVSAAKPKSLQDVYVVITQFLRHALQIDRHNFPSNRIKLIHESIIKIIKDIFYGLH